MSTNKHPLAESETAEVKRQQPVRYFKLLNADLKHFEFQYVEGLNVLIEPFRPGDACQSGGLYFTDFEHIGKFVDANHAWIAPVTIPPGATVYHEPCETKWKSDRIVLGPKRPFKEFLAEQTEDTILRWMAMGCSSAIMELLDPQPLAACMAFVKRFRYSNGLVYVKVHTAELSLAAVEAHPMALAHVRPEFLTHELAMMATRKDPHVVNVFKDEAFRLAAVAEKPDAINHMTDPSRAVIEAALKAAPPSAKIIVNIRL